MHELGVLRSAVKTVEQVARQNQVDKIRFVTLEVGESSSFVPEYLEKLFPIAIDGFSMFEEAQLKLATVPGTQLVIKEIGY